MLEQETLHAFVSGDERALEEVIDTYSKSLLRYCISILCDVEEAKDVLQDTFIKAYEKRRQFQLGTSMNAWLYRIAYTTAINAVRRRKLRFKLWKASEDISPAQESYISEPLYSILSSLSVADRALLYGRVLDERSYQELSHILNVSESTLRKRFERLRSRLAKEVEHRETYAKEEWVQ
ncbi:RNA polymerase sigma factor [Paenibacillus koleovorans]|uniref:RNA polymerase sigma factor n=1 Tax=Paenibacillus koleovorans TaxID=121608 RepID=UPI0013E3EDB7|nr:RNA polymerase sigma factor [Paenibacillus koleovorans]